MIVDCFASLIVPRNQQNINMPYNAGMNAHHYTPQNAQILIAQLRETPNRFAELLDDQNFQTNNHPQTPNEILAHLVSCAEIWSYEIYAMLTKEMPSLEKIDPDDWNTTVPYQNQKFEHILQKFTLDRKILLDVLEDLAPEQWERRAEIGGQVYAVFGLVWRIAEHEKIQMALIR